MGLRCPINLEQDKRKEINTQVHHGKIVENQNKETNCSSFGLRIVEISPTNSPSGEA
jgi:hypothetical protein